MCLFFEVAASLAKAYNVYHIVTVVIGNASLARQCCNRSDGVCVGIRLS